MAEEQEEGGIGGKEGEKYKLSLCCFQKKKIYLF